MSRMETVCAAPRWHAIYTKPQEEGRAEANLAAGGIEALYPRVRQERRNPYTGKAVHLPRPLFPRYIFARFDAATELHRVCYTRGVKSLVSFGGGPLPVEDEVIALLRSRVGEDGFVPLDDGLRSGDEVEISDGPLRGMRGVFDRSLSGERRVMVLLTAIRCGASVTVERASVQRAARPAPGH